MTTAEDSCRSIVEAIEITRTEDHDACITYCTILDVHLSNALKFPPVDQNTILQTLADILNNHENEHLLEAIGWDVVTMLLPFLGQKATNDNAGKVLDILVAKGNSKEVFLKCVEGLKSIVWERTYDEDDDDDGGEATLTESLAKLTANEDEVKVDPILQTVGLYRAIEQVFKRIKSDRPVRFLTTFAAALLINVTTGFQSLVNSEELDVLHNLVCDFITSNIQDNDDSENGKDLRALLEGTLTTYVPVYMGNNMLFWTGQYWETSHAIPSNRVKSKDLVNTDLEMGSRRLFDLTEKLALIPSRLFDYAVSPPPDEIDLETSFPEGDSFVPIDPVGALLLFACTYTHDPEVIYEVTAAYSSTDLLAMHRYLVDAYLDEASLNVVDAIILLGMMIGQRLLPEDLPSFISPQDPAPSEFLEYLQRMAAMAATCPSENLRPLIYSLVEQLLDKSSPEGRLFYILDTLDHCPYDNLKVAVIGTLKKQMAKNEPNSLFSTPGILTDIGPRVFRLPAEVLEDEEVAWDKVTFIIEALSLYRLLLLKHPDSIVVTSLAQMKQTHTEWLLPLRKSFETWVTAAGLSSKDSEEDEGKLLMGRIVIEHLDRIDEIAKAVTQK